MSKFQPLDDRILIKKNIPVTKTLGGIIIPDTATDKPQDGIVIEVGPGKRGNDGNRIPLSVTEGDKVIFGKNAGIEITFEDEQYWIMLESEIIAKIS